MMKSILFFSVVSFFLLGLLTTQLYAQSSSSNAVIDATVKGSLCGDTIIEGEEDCEGDNLNSGTCLNLGFLGGELSCDDDCSFDTTACIRPTPTLFPTAAPTSESRFSTSNQNRASLTPTPSFSPTDNLANDSASQSVQTSVLQELVAQITSVFQKQKKETVIPEKVSRFDFDQSGKIEPTELFEAVSLWLRDWRSILDFKNEAQEEERKQHLPSKVEQNNCDLNFDQDCDLTDFSILLYYANR